MHLILHSFNHTLMISSFVLSMMIVIDYLNVVSNGKMNTFISKGTFRQYFIACLLGVMPGCLGAFVAVSLYLRGVLSFGALTACMIATAGDESFVMLALFPKNAVILFSLLFIIGMISACLIDYLIPKLKISTCETCDHSDIHEEDKVYKYISLKSIIVNLKGLSLNRFLLILICLLSLAFIFNLANLHADWGWENATFFILLSVTLYIVISVPDHYLKEHIWEHIIKLHIWKVFLWAFGSLLVVNAGIEFLNLEKIASANMFYLILFACIIGLIPQSGPHLIFVFMFSKNLIPFSVLLASSISQEGHGIIPLLSHSLKDVFRIKTVKFVIALTTGFTLYYFGF